MRSIFTSTATLILSAIILTGCLSNTTLYNKRLLGKFNNHDFAFLKNKYPMVLDAKGVENDALRRDLIAIMTEEYQNHHKFHNTELVSALEFEGEDEISYVIAVNPNPNTTARNICSAKTAHLQNGVDLTAIKSTHFAFCRKDMTLTYISAKFDTPVAATSQEFRHAIHIAADNILYRNSNRFLGCNPKSRHC